MKMYSLIIEPPHVLSFTSMAHDITTSIFVRSELYKICENLNGLQFEVSYLGSRKVGILKEIPDDRFVFALDSIQLIIYSPNQEDLLFIEMSL